MWWNQVCFKYIDSVSKRSILKHSYPELEPFFGLYVHSCVRRCPEMREEVSRRRRLSRLAFCFLRPSSKFEKIMSSYSNQEQWRQCLSVSSVFFTTTSYSLFNHWIAYLPRFISHLTVHPSACLLNHYSIIFIWKGILDIIYNSGFRRSDGLSQ